MNFNPNAASEFLVKSGFSKTQADALAAVIATNQDAIQASGAPSGMRPPRRTFEEVASDGQNLAQVRQVLAMAKRLGVTIESGALLDINKIDVQLAAGKAAGKVSTDDSVRFKTCLAQLNLIY
jgi:hypothetical protein